MVNMKRIRESNGRFMPNHYVPLDWRNRVRQKLKGRKRISISKDELYKLYWEEEMSLNEIARKIGCAKRTIAVRMTEYGIPRRARNHGRKLFSLKKHERSLKTRLSKKDRELIALAIDLEGTITITSNKNKGVLSPLVCIGNTNKAILEKIRRVSKMGVIRNGHEERKNRKKSWKWMIYNVMEVKHLLEQILPFLIVKRRQGELVIGFCNIRIKNFGEPITKKVKNLYQEVKALNKKGP